MALLAPPPSLQIEAPQIPDEMLELHERLSARNFDLVYVPDMTVLEGPISVRTDMESPYLDTTAWFYEDYDATDSSIDTLSGDWILFENTKPPQIFNRPGLISEYIDDPFIEFFEAAPLRELFDYKYHREKCEDFCRNGFSIQHIMKPILPSLEQELGLDSQTLRLPTVAEYLFAQEFYYPFLRETETSEWTATKVITPSFFGTRQDTLYLIKKAEWRSPHTEGTAFSYHVDGITGSDDACPGLGFRVVVDLSLRHEMEYTRGIK